MTNAPCSTRVNARIDAVAEAQLRYVTERTDMTVTDALKTAIGLMYEKVAGESSVPSAFLQRAGSFVAAGDSGKSDGATNYKAIVARSVAAKHGC